MRAADKLSQRLEARYPNTYWYVSCYSGKIHISCLTGQEYIKSIYLDLHLPRVPQDAEEWQGLERRVIAAYDLLTGV